MLLTTKTVVFIDANITDVDHLVNGVLPGISVQVLTPHQNGIAQISNYLRNHPANNIQIVSHGAPGCLYLGNAQLNLATLADYADLLQGWFSQSQKSPTSPTSLTSPTSPTLTLYGCNVAAGDAGAEFLAKLHELTGAAIGASTSKVGAAELGGSWHLDVGVNSVNPLAQAFDLAELETYSGVFEEFSGTNEDGSVSVPVENLNPPIAGTPYPSVINVSGVTGVVTDITITFTNFSHGAPDDLDILLVSPTGESLVLMSDAGGESQSVLTTLTFDDTAAEAIPDAGPLPFFTSATYRPANYTSLEEEGATIPTTDSYIDNGGNPVVPSSATDFSVFDGIDPNGDWKLYVVDDRDRGNGTFTSWTLNITTEIANTPPSITSPNTANFAENGTGVVLDVNASDPDPDTLTFSFTGNGVDESLFDINGSTGEITFKAVPNFEAAADNNANNDYEVQVQVNDGNGGITTQDIVINVTNVNEEATGSVSFSGSFIVGATLTAVTTGLTGTDPDGAITNIAYQWERSLDGNAWDGINGATASTYNIQSGDAGYFIRIKVTYDAGGFTGNIIRSEASATKINGIPTITSSATANFNENATGTVIDVNATDPDSDSLTYSLTGSGADNSQFSIDENTGVVTFQATPNFEAKGDADQNNVYEIQVQVDDGKGGTDTQDITVNLQNVNEPPSGSITFSGTLTEGEVLTANFTGLGTDPDGTIGSFSIAWEKSANGTTGWTAINGANTGNYTLTAEDIGFHIRVSLTYSDSVYSNTINSTGSTEAVIPGNKPPVFTSSTTANYAENGIDPVIDVNATDADGDSIIYSLTGTGNDNGLFSIDENSGVVTFNSSPDFETPTDLGTNNIYNIQVTATDGEDPVTQNIAITVTDANDPATGTVTFTGTPTQGQTLPPGTIELNDQDGGGVNDEETLIFIWEKSLDGSTNWQTVQSTIAPSPLTLTQDEVGFFIRLRAVFNDLNGNLESIASDPTPQVANVNDAPVGPPAGTINPVSEDTSFTLALSVLLQGFTDADGNPLDVTGITATHGSVTINTGEGTFTYNPETDYNGPVTLNYTVTDGLEGGETPASLGFTVTAVNDAPVVILPSGNSVLIPANSSSGAASIYPMTLAVPATINGNLLTGTISDLNVTINNLSHSWPADIDMLLVGPDGTSIVLMADAGGGFTTPLDNVTLTLDDEAAGPLPDGQITAGSYQPTNLGNFDDDIAYTSTPTLAGFNGQNPAGEWKLYVLDDEGGAIGELAGFTLNFTLQDDPNLTNLDATFELTSTFSPSTNEDTPITFSAANGNALQVNDVDGNESLTVTLTATQGVLSAIGGPEVEVEASQDGSAVTLIGTRDAINAALDNGITFTPANNFNSTVGGPAGISIIASDGGTEGNGNGSFEINVVSENDPTDINELSISQSNGLNQGSTLTLQGTFTDVDGIVGESITYTWQSSGNGIDWTPIGTGTSYTLTQAEVTQYIRLQVSYDDIENRSTTFELGFGDNKVINVNDAPVLTDNTFDFPAVAEDAGIPSGAVGTLVSSLVALGDNVTDVDFSPLTGIALVGADSANGNWYFSTDGGVNWSMVASNVSQSVALLLKPSARLYFRPDANYDGDATITFHAWDQTGGTDTFEGQYINITEAGGSTPFSSASDTASVSVAAVNDAPVHLFRSDFIIPEVGTMNPYPVAPTAQLDPLNGLIQTITVNLIGLTHEFPDDLDILLQGPDGTTVVLMSDAGGGTPVNNLDLTFSASAPTVISDNGPLTAGTFKTADYQPGDSYPGDTPQADSGLGQFIDTDPNGQWQLYVVDDSGEGGGGSLAGYQVVFTTSANETVNYTITTIRETAYSATTDEDTALTFSLDNGNAITVQDVDAGSNAITTTLLATNGTLSVSNTTGLSVDGNGSNILLISGPVANINAALDGLTFTPGANYAGGATITMTTNDGGSTGTGGSLADEDIINITIDPVDDGQAAVSITGTNGNGAAVEGTQLTANFNPANDPDGVNATPNVVYAWQQFDGEGWSTVATSSTFTPDDAQYNRPIRVQVTYTDGQGFRKTITSNETGPTQPISDGVGSSTISISGTFTEDQQLTAVTSGINDPDGNPEAVNYRWEMAATSDAETWTPIGTASTLDLDEAQADQFVRLVVTYTDAQGFDNTLTTTATKVTPVNDGPATGLVVSGSGAEASELSTNFASLTDPDGAPSADPTYQWYQSNGVGGYDSISGATGSTYTPDDAQVGKAIRVEVTYTDGQGFVTTITSSATEAITATDDGTADPLDLTFTGTARDESPLSVGTALLSDPDGLPTDPEFAFQWEESSDDGASWNPIGGANSASFTPDDAQVDKVLRVLVTYTDAQNFRKTIESEKTGIIADFNDLPTGSVVLNEGDLAEGTELSITNTLADEDDLGVFSYQWQQSADGSTNWVNVPVPEGADPETFGKTASFTPDDAQVNQYLQVVVSYTDGSNNFTEVPSNATSGPITNVNDDPTVDEPLSTTLNEDDAGPVNFDLLTGANDEDGNTLNVDAESLTVTNGGNDTGISLQGNNLVINPAAYNYLAVGEQAVVEYSYTITDGNGGSIGQTAQVTITGSNDGPVIGGGGADKVAILSSTFEPDWIPDIVSKVEATGLFTTVDSFNLFGEGLPSLDWLQNYDSVLVWSEPFSEPGLELLLEQLGSNLAAYVDSGGGVVVNSFLFDPNFGLGGQWSSGGYSPFQAGTWEAGGSGLTLAATLPTHPVLAGVTTFNGGEEGYRNAVTGINDNATLVATWSDGVPLISDLQTFNGGIVGLNFFPISSDIGGPFWDATTDGDLLMANALEYVGSGGGAISETATEEDDTFTVDLLTGASDPDGTDSIRIDEASIQVTGNAGGISRDGATLTVNPSFYNSLPANGSEVITYTYTIVDDKGGSVQQTATITINGVNDAPNIGGQTSDSVVEDDETTTVNGTLTISDPDTGEAAFQTPLAEDLQGTYGSFTFNTETNEWTYTLDNANPATNALKGALGENPAEQVSDTLTVKAVDGTEQTITVNITGANDGAEFSGTFSGALTEDNATTQVSGPLSVTDPDTGEAIVQLPNSLEGTYGSISYDDTLGTWTYTLNNADTDTDALQGAIGENPAQEVQDVFTFSTPDGTTQDVTITITGANDAAIITGDTLGGSLTEDVATDTLSGSFSITDVDGNGAEESFQPLDTLGTYGSFSLDSLGNWNYTLDNENAATDALTADEPAQEQFTITSFDGTETILYIDITGANDAPRGDATTELPSGTEDTDYTISETDLLVGFSDPEGGELSVVGLATTNGTLSGPVDGVYTFTPDPDFTGTVELTYQVVDDQDSAINASQSFIIGAVNDGPTNLFRRAIIIPEQGTTTPYPVATPTEITGLAGTITSLKVTLKGLSHTYPDDLDILLKGPDGKVIVLMSDVGGEFTIDNVNLTFDSAASLPLLDSGQLTSGSYKTSNPQTGDSFPAGTPSPTLTSLTGFNGTNPNGIWQLYISDDEGPDGGSLEGFKLEFTTSASETFTYEVTTTTPAAFTNVATDEDTALTFSTLLGNAISISDIDAGDGDILVTLTVTNGSLSLGNSSGVTVQEEGTSLTLTGTLDAINTALNGLTFLPTAGYAGASSFTIDTNDQGFTGTGDPGTDSDTVTITVNAVDDGQITDLAIGNTNGEGAAVEGTELTATFTLGSDPDGVSATPNVSYQWQQLVDLPDEGPTWLNIATATGENFTPDDAQFNAPLRVQVTYTDAQGFTKTVTSEPTGATVPINDGIGDGSVVIIGNFLEGETLQAGGGINDPDGFNPATSNLMIRWEMAPGLDTPDGEWTEILSGPTAESLTLDDAQANQYVRMVVTYTDVQGFPETLTSAAQQVTPVDDGQATGLQIIPAETGTPIEEGVTLTTNFETIKGSDPDTFPDSASQGEATAYQWQETDGQGGFINIDGATGSTFTPDDAQVGKFLRVVVTYTDGQGNTADIIAATAGPLTPIDDGTATGLLLDGPAIEGETLTALVTNLVDPDGLPADPAYAYQWQQFNVELNQWENIPVPEGEDPATYGKQGSFVPDDAQVDKSLRVLVTYTDSQGFRETIESDGTEAIINTNDEPTGTVTINEPLIEETALTFVNTIADEDGLNTFTYEWQQSSTGIDGWTPIANTNSTTFTPDDPQVGQHLRVVVTYTDGRGEFTTVEGPATQTTVQNINDEPTVGEPPSQTYSEDDVDPLPLDLLTGANDVDSDTLNVDAESLTLDSGNGDGITLVGNSLEVNPNAYNYLAVGETEVVKYSYTISDGNAASVDQTAMITITGANDGPGVEGEITSEPVTEEDASFTIDLLTGASDPDTSDSISVDPESVQITGNAAGLSLNGNILTVDPSAYNSLPVDGGEEIAYTYDIIDGNGGRITQTANITITGVNDAPNIGGQTSDSVVEDDETTTVSGSLTITDPDMGEAAFQAPLAEDLQGTYGSFTFNPETNQWSYTLDNADPDTNALTDGQAASDTLTVKAIDGTEQTITVTITGANDLAEFSGTFSDALTEDDATTQVSGPISVTDPDTGEAIVQPPVSLEGTYGSISYDDSLGTWTYTLNNEDPDTDALQGAIGENPAQEVQDVFTFSTPDGTTQDVTITIIGANDAAIISGDTLGGSLTEDAASDTLSGSFGITDVDGNGAEESFQPLTDVEGTYGSLSMDSLGAWSYTLNNENTATDALTGLEPEGSIQDEFTITSFDGTTTTLYIDIIGANDAPRGSATAELQPGSEDTDYTISETDLLTGFSDPENGTLSVMGLTATNGTLSGPVNGEYTFTPDDDFSGTVELSYQVVDDQGAATEASQSFTIGAVNDGPTNLFRQAIIIPEQGPANLYPVANQPADISGLTGSITDLNVTLKGLSHSNPDDLDILLVGPAGQTVALMSDMGGSFTIDNVNLTFDDAAPVALPDASQITSGVYRPGNIGQSDILPGDITSNVIKLSGFNGTNPNGTWRLYISDDLADNGGSLEGYELRFTTSTNEVFTYSATTTGAEVLAATINEDTPLAFSTLMGNAISISDIDAGDSDIQVTLSVTNGSLSLGSQTGITVESDGTTLILTGPVAALNTALNGLTFSPTTNYAGAASLTIDTNDLGANGTGDPGFDIDTIDITINPVDDGQITDLVITGTNGEGAAVEEQSLSAIFTLGSDPDGVSGTPNVTYQWQQFNAELEQWDNIPDANGESFTPNDASSTHQFGSR
jgi:VCBS repeat-containing protein